MYLREWTLSLRDDFIHSLMDGDDSSSVEDYVIGYVRDDLSGDYCIPAQWDAWPIGSSGDSVVYCVTRLSAGASGPQMRSGYCYVARTFSHLCDSLEEIEVYTPTGGEIFKCSQELQGHTYYMWECPDGKFRAQLSMYAHKEG